jgi:hypothetical protein
VSTVSFVVGALAGGAGLYFILSNKGDSSTAVQAAALPGGGMVNLARRF